MREPFLPLRGISPKEYSVSQIRIPMPLRGISPKGEKVPKARGCNVKQDLT
jgi:hypothetical protein